MLILPVGILIALGILAYLENPEYERNRHINHLVRESLKKEKQRAQMPKRGYAFAQIGWSEKVSGGGDAP